MRERALHLDAIVQTELTHYPGQEMIMHYNVVHEMRFRIFTHVLRSPAAHSIHTKCKEFRPEHRTKPKIASTKSNRMRKLFRR